MRWVVATTVAAWIGLPSSGLGQMLEERDRDQPPAEQPAEIPKETVPDFSATEKMMVELTNEFRKQHQRDPVDRDPRLNEAAQYFADYMARTGKYGHTADGQRPSERAVSHGYEYCIVAENIAYQYRSTGFTAEELAKAFVTGWENSPEHRDNMLDPAVTEIGLAVTRRKNAPAYFAVQMFGRPESKAISFQVVNKSDSTLTYTVKRQGSDKSFTLRPQVRRVHQRCRPTEIDFEGPELNLKREVNDGAQYVVRPAANGDLEVIQQ